jgi:hypothetical protein
MNVYASWRGRRTGIEPTQIKNIITTSTTDIGPAQVSRKEATSPFLISRRKTEVMIDIAEMKKRILATLEEAWADSANPLLNTIIDPTADPTEPTTFENCVRELFLEGLIDVGMTSLPRGSEDLSRDDALSEIGKLTAYYKFDSDEGIWLDSRNSGPPYGQTPEPEVILTDAGKQRSFEIVDQLGHNWWRAKR